MIIFIAFIVRKNISLIQYLMKKQNSIGYLQW